MVRWRRYAALSAVIVLGGLALSGSSQEQARSQETPPPSLSDPRLSKPTSDNLVRLKIAFPETEKKPFFAMQREGGIIEVDLEGRLWCISPTIKNNHTVSLEVFVVKKVEGDRFLKDSFERIEINRYHKKEVTTRAPFTVELENLVFNGPPPRRSPD